MEIFSLMMALAIVIAAGIIIENALLMLPDLIDYLKSTKKPDNKPRGLKIVSIALGVSSVAIFVGGAIESRIITSVASGSALTFLMIGCALTSYYEECQKSQKRSS